MIASSAGAGLALATVHDVAFETDVLSALSSPEVEKEASFVIPQYAVSNAKIDQTPNLSNDAPIGTDSSTAEPGSEPVTFETASVTPLDLSFEDDNALYLQDEDHADQRLLEPDVQTGLDWSVNQGSTVSYTQPSASRVAVVPSGPDYIHGIYR